MKPPSALFLPCALAFAVITAAASAAARADTWEKVASGSNHTVEIDASVLLDAEHGTKVTWGRIVLSDSEAKQAGYRSIKALNRYDCLGRRFTTVKRVYMDDHGDILREEAVPEQDPVTVRHGSIDEQIWRKVCGITPATDKNQDKTVPNTPKDISKMANAADRAARKALRNAKLAQPPEKSPVSRQNIELVRAEIKPIPIPMPNAPQNPAPPIAPKPPDHPVVSPSQKRDTSPPPRRRATQPLLPPTPTAVPAPTPAPNPPARDTAKQHAPQPSLFPENGTDWSYSGATGPEFWGNLHPEWKLCSEGKRQSPIDFMESKPVAVNLDPVKFDYRPANFAVINDARLLRARVKTADGLSMEVRGQRYILEGFALHRPGETLTNDRMGDMEAHFFHRNDKGRIAVLAVQFVRGSEPNAPLQTLLNNLPLERGDSYTPQATLDMAAFLPPGSAHYLYMGSLTMPPCTEDVLWVVMKEPLTLSDGQFEVFSRLHGNNARPPQPAFDRLILGSQ